MNYRMPSTNKIYNTCNVDVEEINKNKQKNSLEMIVMFSILT